MAVIAFKFKTTLVAGLEVMTATDNVIVVNVNGSNVMMLQTGEGTLIEVQNVADLVGLNYGDSFKLDENGRIVHFQRKE